jgi:pimeloyl-ACP methyl ester carboxylesterase
MKYLILLAVSITATLSFAQKAIDRQEEILVGGIKQFITIQSADTTLPLLLFLHGGPGGSVMNYSDKFSNKLQNHFVVVHWDQRETGRTRELNPSPVPLTLGQFQGDTQEVIGYLLRKFRREKLYLAGHSWGTALGFHIARTHPEWLYAFIAIGPMINQLESERVALALMNERAARAGNAKALAELGEVRVPFENGRQLYYHRKWLQEMSGSRRSLSKDYVESWAATWLPLFREASHENLSQSLPSIACPVYFMVGRRDFQTSSAITEEYYHALSAPKKALFWFETGHSIPSSAPARMQEIMIEKVLAETFVAAESPGRETLRTTRNSARLGNLRD